MNNLAASTLSVDASSDNWNFHLYSDNTFSISSASTSNYLATDPNNSDALIVNTNFDDYEEWYLIDNGDLTICVLNAKSRVFITVDGASTISISETCGADQKFTIAWWVRCRIYINYKI